MQELVVTSNVINDAIAVPAPLRASLKNRLIKESNSHVGGRSAVSNDEKLRHIQ